MNNTKLLGIKATIYEMGLRFNQQPSPEKINAYAQDLMEYEPHQITFAFRQVINSGSSFFPSLAEILKHLRPPETRKEDLAPVIVNEMLQAIRYYGQYDEERMKASVSENARLAFDALGNTMDIRLSENIETTKAQLERLVKGVLANKDASYKTEQLAQIGIGSAKVISLPNKTTMKGLDYSNFLPDSPA